jgi:HEAT repeat protein
MWKLAILATVLSTILCCPVLADGQNAVPDQLALTAARIDLSATGRANALDAIGRLGADAKAAVARLIPLLGCPGGDPDQQDYLRLHVVRALKGIGPAAVDALPALAAVEGDATLNAEVADAVEAITPPKPKAVGGKAADAAKSILDGLPGGAAKDEWMKKYACNLVDVLKSKDPCERRFAVLSLAGIATQPDAKAELTRIKDIDDDEIVKAIATAAVRPPPSPHP